MLKCEECGSIIDCRPSDGRRFCDKHCKHNFIRRTVTHKQCAECAVTFPLSGFPKKSAAILGVGSYCNACQKTKDDARYQSVEWKKKSKERQVEYAKKNADKIRARARAERRTARAKKRAMLGLDNGRCLDCGIAMVRLNRNHVRCKECSAKRLKSLQDAQCARFAEQRRIAREARIAEKILKKAQITDEERRAQVAAKQRRYYYKDKKKHLLRRALYRSSHRHKMQEQARRRYARIEASSIDPNGIAEIYRSRLEDKPIKCYWCGMITKKPEDRHVDHVIPLSKGGAHAASNLCISCVSCNLRKGDKLPSEFATQGVLL